MHRTTGMQANSPPSRNDTKNMAPTPDGKKLYVANGRSNSLSAIDTEHNTTLGEIPAGELPWGFVVR